MDDASRAAGQGIPWWHSDWSEQISRSLCDLVRSKQSSQPMKEHSTKHIEQDLIDLDKGPLPQDIVKALDEAWEVVRLVTSEYWH